MEKKQNKNTKIDKKKSRGEPTMKKKTAGKTKPMHRAGWTQRELRTDTNAH
jgi:hypothetical protein